MGHDTGSDPHHSFECLDINVFDSYIWLQIAWLQILRLALQFMRRGYLHTAAFWGSLDVKGAQVLAGWQADITAVPWNVELDSLEAVQNCRWNGLEPASK